MVKTLRPESLSEALDFRKKHKAQVFAGGTDLMVAHRGYTGTGFRLEKNILFVDNVSEMKEIYEKDAVLHIGASATVSQILEHTSVPEVLRKSLELLAAPGIRNRASMGGNIANASPAGDSIPPLYVLGATLILQSQGKLREIPVQDYFLGPRKSILQDDEILTAIHIPLKPYAYSFYKKVGTRKANALSKLSVAGLASVEKNKLTEFHIAFGAVGPVVVKINELDSSLCGKRLSELDIPRIIEAYAPYIKPINDQRSTAVYRKTTTLNLLKRFITLLKEVEK